jgi:N-sulfoglucosamine sulfohydrolase
MSSGAKKNILLLVADDLGREQMGCYGSTAALTPNLDSLAASGTRFDMAFTSTASCSGSRTVVYTGLHTHESGSYGLTHGRNGFGTFENVETMPLLFNHLGYRTGILGKVHVGPAERYPWHVRQESESRDVVRIAKQALTFFQECEADERPFLLTIGFVDPHRALSHRGGFGNVLGNYDPDLEDRIWMPDQVDVPPYLTDLPEVRQELAEYYRAIYRMDQGVGRILGALANTPLVANTLVIFLSDNGPPFVNSKTTLYDAGVHLPCLIRAPGYSSTVNPNLVSYIDLLPTCLDWAGARDMPSILERGVPRRGRSLLPIIDQQAPNPGWDYVFGSHTFHEITNYWPTRFLRTRRHKYHRNVCWQLDFPFAMDLYASLSFEAMRNSATETCQAMIGPRSLKSYIRRPPEELYDLQADPLEIHNLARDPAMQSTLLEMRNALEKWQLETGDLWLWRDGAPVVRYVSSEYVRQGLRIPDRFDFDPDNPGSREIPFVQLD